MPAWPTACRRNGAPDQSKPGIGEPFVIRGMRFSPARVRLNAESRNAARFCAFHRGIASPEISSVDQRDQELLDKQLRRIAPAPRNNGVMVLAILAVFLAGMALGSAVEQKAEAIRIASNDTMHAIPGGASPSARQ